MIPDDWKMKNYDIMENYKQIKKEKFIKRKSEKVNGKNKNLCDLSAAIGNNSM